MASRSPQNTRHVLPLSDPDRTTALSLWRYPYSPDDPLDIALDFALLDQLGWRSGDRIAFDPIPLDRRTREGGLIIRRATRDEPAIKLRKDHYERKPNPYSRHFPDGPDGPDVEWPFPQEWMETFFPPEYVPGPGPPVYAPTSRRWMLRDLLDQRDRVVVSLDCSLLEFRLQRTDPDAPALDVHLPLGVLHLMGWSAATPLALTSRRGFDPSAPDDTLTIRRCPPGESNLTRDGDRFICRPGPSWLDLYFPGLHDNTEKFPSRDPGPMPADPDDDLGDPDFVRFPTQTPTDQEHDWDLAFEDEERDTFCVNYPDLKLGPESLSFVIQRPQSPETDEVPNVVPVYFLGLNPSTG